MINDLPPVTDLQQACGSREAEREGLAVDEEGLSVGSLHAERERVQAPDGPGARGKTHHCLGPHGHGRVRRLKQVVHSQTQSR